MVPYRFIASNHTTIGPARTGGRYRLLEVPFRQIHDEHLGHDPDQQEGLDEEGDFVSGEFRCAVHPDGVAEVVTQPVGEAPAARRCPTAAKRIDVYRTLAGATRVSSSMGLMCTGTGLRSASG